MAASVDSEQPHVAQAKALFIALHDNRASAVAMEIRNIFLMENESCVTFIALKSFINI